MNLIVVFDLSSTLTPVVAGRVLQKIQGRPECNGLHMSTDEDPPRPYHGRVSYALTETGNTEVQVRAMFHALREQSRVTQYEVSLEPPAVL